MYTDDIVLVANSGMELQTMLEVVQAYVMRWRMTFNTSKSKIMVIGKRKGGTSWKIGKEIMKGGRRLSTWVCGLIGNYEVMFT